MLLQLSTSGYIAVNKLCLVVALEHFLSIVIVLFLIYLYLHRILPLYRRANIILNVLEDFYLFDCFSLFWFYVITVFLTSLKWLTI